MSSCAFPAAFPARRESEIYPAFGRRDLFYGDGGMFDNLPFQPMLELFSLVQKQHLAEYTGEWTKIVQAKLDAPDLFLAGALDPIPVNGEDSYDSFSKIYDRSGQLANNEKINGMVKSSGRVHQQLKRSVTYPQEVKSWNRLAYAVNAAVLPVFPSSGDHLNGTFAFCSSLGLDPDRMNRSIADGCYQTLKSLAEAVPGGLAKELVQISVKKLCEAKRIPKLTKRAGHHGQFDGQCPFFESTGSGGKPIGHAEPMPFECPFSKHDDGSVYDACIKDRMHN